MSHAVTMTRSDLQALAEQHVAAMNRHDAAALADLYAADATVESPLFATLRGHAAVEESYRQMFQIFRDIELKLESLLIDPPGMAMTTRFIATQEGELFGLPATHKKIELATTWLVTFEDGLIIYERRIYDFTGFLVQLGVLRAKPAKP
jgi:steroid delta-isomerase-like uncharacterized protein